MWKPDFSVKVQMDSWQSPLAEWNLGTPARRMLPWAFFRNNWRCSSGDGKIRGLKCRVETSGFETFAAQAWIT
jgi:hypothetical protein